MKSKGIFIGIIVLTILVFPAGANPYLYYDMYITSDDDISGVWETDKEYDPITKYVLSFEGERFKYYVGGLFICEGKFKIKTGKIKFFRKNPHGKVVETYQVDVQREEYNPNGKIMGLSFSNGLFLDSKRFYSVRSN